MHLHSKWVPKHWDIPDQNHERLDNFECKIEKLFKKQQGRPNLLLYHHFTLRYHPRNNTFLVVQCDKNLGPAIVKCKTYINWALQDHLSDTSTYKQLSTLQANNRLAHVKLRVGAWISQHEE
eukprot:8237779-Ditylum_brightwellii.AAC.1